MSEVFELRWMFLTLTAIVGQRYLLFNSVKDGPVCPSLKEGSSYGCHLILLKRSLS